MSFGGPIDSMINANKSNLRLLNKRKRLKDLASEYKTPHQKFTAPNSTKESRQLLQKQLERIKKRDQQRTIIISVIAILVTLMFFYIVYNLDYSGIIEVIK